MALIRSLRLLLLLGLGVLVGGILYSIAAATRTGPALPAAPEAPDPGRSRVVQEATDVEIVRTRAGRPALRLEAALSRTYAGGAVDLSDVLFRLIGPDGRETLVEAPRAVSEPPVGDPSSAALRRRPVMRPRDEIGSWLLEGGVTIQGPDGMKLLAPALLYVEADGQARTGEQVSFARGPAVGSAHGLLYDVGAQRVRFREDVSASMTIGGLGRVDVTASSASYAIGQSRFEMDGYQATTERGEVLTGRILVAKLRPSGGMERLEGEQGFSLESSHTEPGAGRPSPLARLLALEGRRTLSGRRLAMRFAEDGQPVEMEVEGEASVTASGVHDSPEASILSAKTLVFDLAGGELTRARAAGDVDLKGAPAKGRSVGLRLLGENLEAVVDPQEGSLLRVEGQGEIRLSDEGMESQGSRALLDPNADVWTMSGEDGRPASTTWHGRKIQAVRIEADRRRNTLSARGGVRASYRPASETESVARPEGQALPFFQHGETIHAMAGSMVLSENGRVVRYEDRVRLWQGESRVEADRVALDETRGTLEARGDVVTAFRQPAPEGHTPPSNPSDEIVVVSASSMSYVREERRILYGEPVLVTQGPMRLRAGSLAVVLDSQGRSAERLEATGQVEVSEHGRTGRGDRLVVEMDAGTMTLSGSGRQASVQDEAGQQVVRGRSLTIDRAGDRILVESEVGGRTWINFKPRQKGAPGLGSSPGD